MAFTSTLKGLSPGAYRPLSATDVACVRRSPEGSPSPAALVRSAISPASEAWRGRVRPPHASSGPGPRACRGSSSGPGPGPRLRGSAVTSSSGPAAQKMGLLAARRRVPRPRCAGPAWAPRHARPSVPRFRPPALRRGRSGVDRRPAPAGPSGHVPHPPVVPAPIATPKPCQSSRPAPGSEPSPLDPNGESIGLDPAPAPAPAPCPCPCTCPAPRPRSCPRQAEPLRDSPAPAQAHARHPAPAWFRAGPRSGRRWPFDPGAARSHPVLMRMRPPAPSAGRPHFLFSPPFNFSAAAGATSFVCVGPHFGADRPLRRGPPPPRGPAMTALFGRDAERIPRPLSTMFHPRHARVLLLRFRARAAPPTSFARAGRDSSPPPPSQRGRYGTPADPLPASPPLWRRAQREGFFLPPSPLAGEPGVGVIRAERSRKPSHPDAPLPPTPGPSPQGEEADSLLPQSFRRLIRETPPLTLRRGGGWCL